jgi:hypothetical protein
MSVSSIQHYGLKFKSTENSTIQTNVNKSELGTYTTIGSFKTNTLVVKVR